MTELSRNETIKEASDYLRGTLSRGLADVKALTPQAAEQAVAALERDRRYQQDVY